MVRSALREAQLAAWRTAPVRVRAERCSSRAERSRWKEGLVGCSERVQRSAVDVCCEVISSVMCLREGWKHGINTAEAARGIPLAKKKLSSSLWRAVCVVCLLRSPEGVHVKLKVSGLYRSIL